MKGIREIRHRIKSVKNTAQITKAMQLVASSKMKRAQDAAIATRPYSFLLADILASVVEKMPEINHPLFQGRPVKQRGVLVISTDKGLCGALNGNLFRLVTEIPRDQAGYVSVGRKATQFITRAGRNLLADFTVSDKVGYNEVRPVVEFLTEAYLEGKIDTIEVIHSTFINTLRQEATLTPVVPFTSLVDQLAKIRAHFGNQVSEKIADDRELNFEPDVTTLLEALPPLFIKQEIYQMMLGAKASEHSARMVAMKSATDNAKTLVGDLTLEYNKARQGAITQEILEIAAAASVE